MDEIGDARVINALRPLITEHRLERIETVLSNRTYNLTVVLEHLYDTGNMSAIMRSADSFGIQRMNLVLKPDTRYKVGRRVSVGSHKWLDIHHYNSSLACAQELRDKGYQLLATHLEGAVPIGEIDFSKPTALVLGNEHYGVSPEMVDLCDGQIVIPMMGFAQSFNVSVAAAISLYHGVQDRIRRLGRSGDLTPDQRDILRERFYRRAVRNCDLLLKGLDL
jgi:tRNA (guanosine-2'-O-)-methyltransferase